MKYVVLTLALSMVNTGCGEPTPAQESDPTDPSALVEPTDATTDDTQEPIDSVLEEPLRVRTVADGDTFEVLRNGEVYRVRMKGIDTPELHGDDDLPEPCAEAAKAFLWDTIGNSEVGLEFDSSCQDSPYLTCYDGYGRLLAYVRLHNGDDLAKLLLKDGLARVYRYQNEVFDRLSDYNALQDTAWRTRRGIWADSGFQCP